AGLLLSLAACGPTVTAPSVKAGSAAPARPTTGELPLIPYPAAASTCSGFFSANAQTSVETSAGDPETERIAHSLGDVLERTRGLHLSVATQASDNTIAFAIEHARHDADTNDERYTLDVSTNRISVKAPTAHGLFNGATTLWQLLTADSAQPIRVPCTHIED